MKSSGARRGSWVDAIDIWLIRKIGRYVIAGIGPLAVSGTHLLLPLLFLHALPPRAFGTFSFLLVAVQLGCAISASLFCAPFQVLLSSSDAKGREGGEAAFLDATLLSALLGGGLFYVIATISELPPLTAACFGFFGCVTLVRWFGRAWCYAHGMQLRVMWSDVTYGIATLSSLAFSILVAQWPTELAGYAALGCGAVAGMIPLGASFLRRQFLRTFAHLRGYGPIWQGHARWALLGVIATEATANAHIYSIVLLKGAAAYAPIAASALLLRPVNVVQNALTEFERPQMARLIGQGNAHDLKRSLLVFRLVLIAVWVGTLIVGCLLFAFDPEILFPRQYDPDFLLAAFLFWTIVAAVLLLQNPECTLLQACGGFRALAIASLFSSVASVAAVMVLLFLGGPLWTIVGVGIGWAVSFVLVHRASRAWLERWSGAGGRASSVL